MNLKNRTLSTEIEYQKKRKKRDILKVFQNMVAIFKINSIDLHFKTHSIPKSKFQKILVENTMIIARKINKLWR